MDKDKIEMKAMMESAAVAEYLTALAKGFKSGIITVEKDGESLTLIPSETAEVEVEARVKKDKARFSLEVTWRVAQAQDDSSSLSISAEAPKAAASDKSGKSEQKCEKKDEKKEEKKEDKKEMKKAEAPAASAPAVKPAGQTGMASVTVSVVKPAVSGEASKPAPKA